MSPKSNLTSSSLLSKRHPLTIRKASQVLLDLSVLALSLLLSFFLRYEFSPPAEDWQRFLFQLPVIVFYELLILNLFGIYKQVWRYTSIPEAKKIILALAVASLPLLAIRIIIFEFFRLGSFSLSIILINSCLATAGLLGIRVLRRIIYEQAEKKRDQVPETTKKRILLLGAGRAGVNTLLEIKGRGDLDFDVRGFLDDDPIKQRAVIGGVKVLGKIQDLPKVVKEFSIDQVILSIAQASRQSIQRIVGICESVPIRVQIIPGMYELLQERVTVSRIRDLQVEDLLGRPAVELDLESIQSFLNNKTVMVTGAGGSIGSELARQITAYPLKKLILLERCEYALFQIERELTKTVPDLEIKAVIADVGEEVRIDSIFKKFAPQVVFHAAAHKHVSLMEENVSEAVKNNILGTYSLGTIAGKYETEAFVLISTDKAVNPTSVMGATKRVAELVVQELNQKYETRFLAVRFGNVIGSTGSVLTIFQDQIKRGEPVTVTHPEMKRYFMTIPEAANLVLEAGGIGAGGEIFILDMGEPVKILNLAKEVIRLSGFVPETDVPIVFTGIRPGEKLTEELQTEKEQLTKTQHPKIFIGRISPYPADAVSQALEKFLELYQMADDNLIRQYLNEFLPEAKLTEAIAESEEVLPASDYQKQEEQTMEAFSGISPTNA